MTAAEEALKMKQQNVLDMALTFTAMNRVFAEGTKRKIAEQFTLTLPDLGKVLDEISFEKCHDRFCLWFTQNVQTAGKELKNGRIMPSRSASYGHAAKIFDVVAKVFVYYCRLPFPEVAERVEKFLHAAIDTPILRELKGKYPETVVATKTIEQIDRSQYLTLQDLARRHIDEEFLGAILPAQYDDIMWRRLNRED